MGNFKFPVEGVKYRIRNVDYRDYLEQRPRNKSVVLRPEHDDPSQHWIFSWVDERARTFRICDADQNSTLYVQSTSDDIKYGTPGANDEDVWKFITDPLKDGKTYIVSELSILYMPDRDEFSLKEESSENRIKSRIRGPNHQWELSEVSPAELPPGQNQQFLIRTLNGQALQFDSSNKLTLDRQDVGGIRRTWLIKDLGNGLCTIFNQISRKYLTARDKGSYEWEPVVMAEGDFEREADKKWTIQHTSNFTYSISIERDVIYRSEVMPQSLALALNNGNAILKPKKAAHNQTWLIEPEDAPIPIVPPDDGTDPTDSNEPAPGITPGEYKLQNIENYVRVVRRNNSYIFLSSVSTSANRFKVELRPNGVVFYSKLNSKDIYLATNSMGEVVGQENVAYLWTVTKKGNSDQYFITNNDNKVLIAPNDRDSAITLGLKTQDAKQLWKFT